MMRVKIAFVVFTIFATSLPPSVKSQTRFRAAAQVVGGVYAFNSENELPLLQSGKLTYLYGVNTSIGISLGNRRELAFDFQYDVCHANHPMVFYYSFGGPGTVSSFDGRVALYELSSDIGLRYDCNKWLQLGLGPSFATDSRTVDIPYGSIEDRVNSYCLGAHGVATARVPFNKNYGGGFYWYYSLKLRYLHSLFFDSHGRDLRNYSQSFLTTSLAAGIGYAF